MRSNKPKPQGVTIIELTIVLLILSILSSVVVTVYASHLVRTKYAVARMDIHALELAASRYQIDLGVYPMSSSYSPWAVGDSVSMLSDTGNRPVGCGYLILCLMHSMSGDAKNPANPRWLGPYLDVKQVKLGDATNHDMRLTEYTSTTLASASPAAASMLDPWGRSYVYIRNDEYTSATLMGTKLPSSSPYAATEIYYNPTTIQIYSKGIDGDTSVAPNAGTDADDVSNFID